MAVRQLPLPGEIIKKSNALCRAAWSSESIWEARMIAVVASKITVNDEDFKEYDIPITEIIGKQRGGKVHEMIDKATDIPMNRIVKIKDEKSGGWAKYNVFAKCQYLPKEGIIRVRFDKDLKPHYLQLKARLLTQINLFEFLALPSTYSQRIFEILKSWDDKPEITIPLDDLHSMLEVPESFKKDFRNFRIKVLEKAAKDIQRHTTLEYEWEPIAKGGQITKRGMTTIAIRFTFSKARIAKAAAEKKEEENDKRKKANNDMAQKVMACYHHCGGDCKEVLGKEECEWCRSVNPKQMRIA